MMKWMMMVVVAGLLAAAPAVQAHCGKCGKGDKDHAGECTKGKACDAWTAGLNLTDEQKTKISEIKAGCDGSKESCGKAKDSIRALLTEEQQKTFDEKCSAGGCGKSKGGCEKSKGGCTKEKAEDKA